MDKAEKYVYIEIYIQSWDEVTDVFYQALKRARARGVEVKLPIWSRRRVRGTPSTMESMLAPKEVCSWECL